MARMVGASPLEVVTMNSLTVNLHLMMATFYKPTLQRYRILLEEHAFPSDDYALESQAVIQGFDPAEALIRLKPREGRQTIQIADVAEVLEREGDSIALVLLPGVQYYTGQAFEIEEITRLAHAKGCVVGFDLAHAAGNLVLRIHDWDLDFAVWCTYKYLNSGPGSVGACFVHERHGMQRDLPRLAGWWGHDKNRASGWRADFSRSRARRDGSSRIRRSSRSRPFALPSTSSWKRGEWSRCGRSRSA
jgi:kynureninase